MREVTIDLDRVLELNEPVGYQIAKKLETFEIDIYRNILGVTSKRLNDLIKEKNEGRIEIFNQLFNRYPISTKRENGQWEYLRSNTLTCMSNWRKLTKGDFRKEYLALEKLNEYIPTTEPKYLKKLSNWLKDVVLEPEEESKVFSQSNIKIL